MFYLHTDKEREKVGKKWFQDAGFCTLCFPCSVLGQAAKSRLSCLKIQKLVYLTLCCAGLHPWEHCLWRHCRSQSTVKQKETLYLRGSDFPCEIFHLIPRQISLCGRLPKRPFSTYNKSQIPLVSLIHTRPTVKQIAVLFLRVKSLCCKLHSKLPLLYCAPLFFFHPANYLASCRENHQQYNFFCLSRTEVRSFTCQTPVWQMMPRNAVKLLMPAYLPVCSQAFWPKHRSCSHFVLKHHCSLSGRRCTSHVGRQRGGCSFHYCKIKLL